jgi:hypothetical protein
MSAQTWWTLLPFITFILGFIAGRRARDQRLRRIPLKGGPTNTLRGGAPPCLCKHSASGERYPSPACPVHHDDETAP